MYTETEENRFLEVTYANGDKEVLYFKDFNSGAMIQNIVDRAKKMAIKDFLDHDQKGLRVQHLLQACVDEFKENEDLPNTTNPDDWARISGKKGERIVFIRTLITGKQGTEPGRSIDTVVQHRPVPLSRAARRRHRARPRRSGDVGQRRPAPARSRAAAGASSPATPSSKPGGRRVPWSVGRTARGRTSSTASTAVLRAHVPRGAPRAPAGDRQQGDVDPASLPARAGRPSRVARSCPPANQTVVPAVRTR